MQNIPTVMNFIFQYKYLFKSRNVWKAISNLIYESKTRSVFLTSRSKKYLHVEVHILIMYVILIEM